MKKNWETTEMGVNEILESQDGKFYISYNSGNYMFSMFESDTGGCETALCCDGNFKILNGDFRKEYEKIIDEGFEKCVEFYESQMEEYSSSWSSV